MASGVVSDLNADFSFGPDRKATAKMPLNAYGRRQSAIPRVEDCRANQRQVIGKGQPAQHRPIPRE